MVGRSILAACVFSTAMLFGSSPAAFGQQETTPAELHRLFADEWNRRLQRDPLFASSRGVTEYNDRLPDVTATAQRSALDEDLQFLERLESIDRAALSPDDQTNYDLFGFVVGHRANLARYQPFRIPLTSDSGFHTRVQRMYESMPFRTIEDYETYLTRLSAVGPYFEQNIGNMRVGLADGFTQPKVILNGIVPSISGAIVGSPEDSVLFTPLLSIPEYISADDADRLRSRASAAIADTVIPAYQEFLQFFTEEYIPGARESLGASELQDGRAYYEDLTRFFTSRDDAHPDEIHELGLREVARIRAEMEEIIEQAEFDGTFAEFIEFLRTDPQFYVDDPSSCSRRRPGLRRRWTPGCRRSSGPCRECPTG